MKLIFLHIVLFISFSYSLTESQLEKIKSKTESLNLAPDFTLLDQDENLVSLSDFTGRKIVLWFYPKASTPG